MVGRAKPLRDAAAIVGIGQNEFARTIDPTEGHLVARDCVRPAAVVHAFGQGLPRQHESMVNYSCDDHFPGPARPRPAALWWSQSDAGPAQIDVAEIDVAEIDVVIKPLVLVWSEGYSVCVCAEAAAFVSGGNVRSDSGLLPVNTSARPPAGTCLVSWGESVPTSAVVLRAA